MRRDKLEIVSVLHVAVVFEVAMQETYVEIQQISLCNGNAGFDF